MADELPVESAPASPSPAAPAPAAAPSSQPAPSPGVVPSPETQAAQAAFNARAYLGERLGNPAIAGQFKTDQEFLDQVAPILQQAAAWRQQAELGQRYAQHAPQFEKWYAEQEEKRRNEAAAAAQQTQKWWTSPEYDRSWEDGVTVNPQTGELVAKPGYDPTLPSKIQRFREFQRQKLNEFLQDPIATIKPGLEGVVAEIVGKAVQQQLGGYQSQQSAVKFVESNADWLYATDPVSKARLMDPVTRGPLLTPAGQRFRQHVIALEQAGVTDIAMQQHLAQKLTSADLLQMVYQQPTAGAPAAPAGVPPARSNALVDAAEQPESNLSLRERLIENFRRSNITDEMIRNGV